MFSGVSRDVSGMNMGEVSCRWTWGADRGGGGGGGARAPSPSPQKWGLNPLVAWAYIPGVRPPPDRPFFRLCPPTTPYIRTNTGVMQGFIQDFSTGGGGGSISATVQPPEVCVCGGDYANTDLISGEWGLPIMHCAPYIYYWKSELMSEILDFVTYFRGGSRILQRGGGARKLEYSYTI